MTAYYKVEFLDYDGNLIIPKGFEDNSWHNDVCPKVTKTITSYRNTITEINIWQDYADENLRELKGKRFVFDISVDNEIIFAHATDDWAEIKKLIGMIFEV